MTAAASVCCRRPISCTWPKKAVAWAHGKPHPENTVRAWQILAEEGDSPESVADAMNYDPVTISPGTHIGMIARMMIDAHIHRVIVVDEYERPIGVVSSTDILGALAHAEERSTS